jgi:hypothetical protein
MAIDFSGVQTTDNYSSVFVPKLQEGQKGVACWLDPAVITYTGTPYTGAYRVNSGSGGSVERYNGSSWAAQAIQGITYNGGTPQIGGSNILKASDATEAATGSKLVMRTAAGYVNVAYLNQSSPDGENPSIAQVFVQSGADGYLRKATIAWLAAYVANQNVVSSGGWNFSSNGGVGIASQGGKLTAYGAAGAAGVMSFWRDGVAAVNFGLDTDNVVRLGGWTDGLNNYRWQSNPAGDFFVKGVIYPSNQATNYLRSCTSSYGSLEMVGSNTGYVGLSFNTSAANTVASMFDASGNGGDYDYATGWHFYWNRGLACLAIGGASAVSGYKLAVNGHAYVAGQLAATGLLYGNNSGKGFGAITITTSTSAPTGGSDGDFHMIY